MVETSCGAMHFKANISGLALGDRGWWMVPRGQWSGTRLIWSNRGSNPRHGLRRRRDGPRSTLDRENDRAAWSRSDEQKLIRPCFKLHNTAYRPCKQHLTSPTLRQQVNACNGVFRRIAHLGCQLNRKGSTGFVYTRRQICKRYFFFSNQLVMKQFKRRSAG